MSDKSSDKWEANPIWRKVVVIPARRCLRGSARAPALPALSFLRARGGGGQDRAGRREGERAVREQWQMKVSCGIGNIGSWVGRVNKTMFLVHLFDFLLYGNKGKETLDE